MDQFSRLQRRPLPPLRGSSALMADQRHEPIGFFGRDFGPREAMWALGSVAAGLGGDPSALSMLDSPFARRAGGHFPHRAPEWQGFGHALADRLGFNREHQRNSLFAGGNRGNGY